MDFIKRLYRVGTSMDEKARMQKDIEDRSRMTAAIKSYLLGDPSRESESRNFIHLESLPGHGNTSYVVKEIVDEVNRDMGEEKYKLIHLSLSALLPSLETTQPLLAMTSDVKPERKPVVDMWANTWEASFSRSPFNTWGSFVRQIDGCLKENQTPVILLEGGSSAQREAILSQLSQHKVGDNWQISGSLRVISVGASPEDSREEHSRMMTVIENPSPENARFVIKSYLLEAPSPKSESCDFIYLLESLPGHGDVSRIKEIVDEVNRDMGGEKYKLIGIDLSSPAPSQVMGISFSGKDDSPTENVNSDGKSSGDEMSPGRHVVNSWTSFVRQIDGCLKENQTPVILLEGGSSAQREAILSQLSQHKFGNNWQITGPLRVICVGNSPEDSGMGTTLEHSPTGQSVTPTTSPSPVAGRPPRHQFSGGGIS